jgi:hypothetical protein
MLQKQHPDIALSIKTRQAIRSILNNLREGVHQLLLDGILEEAEGTKLEKVRIERFSLVCVEGKLHAMKSWDKFNNPLPP